MLGSSYERLGYRRKAFSLDAFLKSASIFVTITPSDVGTMAISVLAGKISAVEAAKLAGNDVPCHAERVIISGLDPVACTERFEDACIAFFDSMVRFNRASGLPKVGGGLFGFAKGYIGVVEAQGSGTFHMHCVVLVAGFPRTIADFLTACSDPVEGETFKSRFRDFVNSVVRSSLPSYTTPGMSPCCPKCGEKNLAAVEPIPKAALQKVPKRFSPISTSVCLSC